MGRLSRRDVVAAMATTVAFGGPARAQGPEEADTLYFVPGGRIGFKRPSAIKAQTNSWHLLSPDQTLQVEVSEALRIDATWDGRMWEQDGRHGLVSSRSLPGGIEHRVFRDKRFGGDADYGAETDVFRDQRWMGQVRVSTSTLGSPGLSVPGGQIARWRAVMDVLRASIMVRPAPAVLEALAEHGLGLAVEGLNPRLVGDRLILSFAPPKTPHEAAGTNGSYILIPELALLPLGSPQNLAEAKAAAFEVYRGFPGSRVVLGSQCRGVVLRETKLSDAGKSTFATTVMAFGRTRELKLTAFYGRADRDRMLQTLERLVASLSLLDRA
jgi:hypothetical protein